MEENRSRIDPLSNLEIALSASKCAAKRRQYHRLGNDSPHVMLAETPGPLVKSSMRLGPGELSYMLSVEEVDSMMEPRPNKEMGKVMREYQLSRASRFEETRTKRESQRRKLDNRTVVTNGTLGVIM